ncbi:MAG: guanine deaminase [Myxococcales bacterium]|nr:guanine deaminase [Myxococcales bacterium]
MTNAQRLVQLGATKASGQVCGSVLLPTPDGRVDFVPHAQISWSDARIVHVQPIDRVPDPASALWLPAFVDLHAHWPQTAVRGQFSGQLLPWLRQSIWPAEAKFADEQVARAGVAAFLHTAQRAGTCSGLVFGPPFAGASQIFAQIAPHGWIEGPAIMEVNGPVALLQSAPMMLTELQTQNRDTVAISPRFAPSLSAEGLAACGLAAAATHWPVQSHLAENIDELRWVAELFAEAEDYTDVYDRAGLLGPRTILAHAIHLSDRELQRLAATGTWVAHCPTSNEALGSGRMPLERLRQFGLRWVLATDVGAGPQLSQFDVMRAFLRLHPPELTTAVDALCRTTAIAGAFLAQFDQGLQGLGTLAAGAPAHLIAVPRPTGNDAEAILRSLFSSLPDNAEQVPLAVVAWGQPLDC